MTEAARVYGESLYELARDEALSDEILSQMGAAAEIFRENPAYLTLLSLPSIPKEERCAVLDKAFAGQVHPYLLNFLKLLTEKGMIGSFVGCAEAFRARFNADRGILPVTAFTAVALEKEERSRLEAKLRALTGKTIELTEKVDPSLMGGVRLEMDGKRYDGTILGRIQELRKTLADTVL